MTAAEFRRLIHNGHGRAILYARENDVSAFHDVILDACLHCYSVDSQTDCTRSGYMFDLVHILPERETFIAAVLHSLSSCDDNPDALQRFRFAGRLVEAGHPGAKQRMYDTYAPGPRYGEAIGVEFADMDGIEGFLFAAAKIGELLQSDRAANVDCGFLIDHSRSTLGEELINEAVLRASGQDLRIDAFRRHVEANESIPWTDARKVDEEELAAAARDLIAANDPELQRRLLGIFFRRPFPGDPHRVLELARSRKRRVAHAATVVLEQVTHPAVRGLAFRLIQRRSPRRMFSITLLSRNFAPGDHRIAQSWYAAETDRQVLHTMGRDLFDLWKRHPEPESEPGMLRLNYERGPCAFCRERVVRRLIELGALPDRWRAECAGDANEEIREMVISSSG